MNSTELVAIFRTETNDVERPYVWQDALLYTYVDEAQKLFCRDTYGIEDARSFKINIKADGTEWYPIDPSILKIRDAINAATGRPVDLVAMEKMGEANLRFDGSRGPIKALITGMEKGVFRAIPIPNEAATIELRTFRLPETISAGDEFEIDEQHILNLLYWVKFRAFSLPDNDARDEKAAAANREAWTAYCAKAKVEQSRVRRPVSTVTYGGI